MEHIGSHKRAYQFTSHQLCMGPAQCVTPLSAEAAQPSHALAGGASSVLLNNTLYAVNEATRRLSVRLPAAIASRLLAD